LSLIKGFACLVAAARESDMNSGTANTRVVCRIRPQSQSEEKSGRNGCLDHTEATIEVFTELGQYPFKCDRIFDENASQTELFEYCAMPLVKDTFAGINSTIIAFGQTGSGKTYTIEGEASPSRTGLVPRVMSALFIVAAERCDDVEFSFRVSYIEIYMEKVKDLLVDQHSLDDADIKCTVKIMGANVTERSITSYEQCMKYWRKGSSLSIYLSLSLSIH
jgi:kinesin family protein 5